MSVYLYSFLTHHCPEMAALAVFLGAILRYLMRRRCERRGLVDQLMTTGNAILLATVCYVSMPPLVYTFVTIFCCACGGYLLCGLVASN